MNSPQDLKQKVHNIQKALNDTMAASPGVLPEGEYTARPRSAKLIEAKTGTIGLEITFKVEDGDNKGTEFRITWWLAERNLPHVKHDLERLQLDGWTIGELPDMDLSRIGTAKRITLRIEEYEGTQRNRIVKVQEVKA